MCAQGPVPEEHASSAKSTGFGLTGGLVKRCVGMSSWGGLAIHTRSWAAHLRSYRDRNLFAQRCIASMPADCKNGAFSIFAGKTETRAVNGRVHTRWHDGVVFVREHAVA